MKTITFILLILYTSALPQEAWDNPLSVHFRGDAKIEVGGPYAGIEMHHSTPALQRISFYYPAANSIDLSTDYWKRDTSFVSSIAVSSGKGERELIGFTPAEYEVTPYSVSFTKSDKEKSLRISYRFSRRSPAMFIIYELTNISSREEIFEIETRLETSVKTSHTFKLKDSAWTEYSEEGSAIYTNFDDLETQNVQIFAANAGLRPVSYTSVSRGGLSENLFENNDRGTLTIPRSKMGRPCAAFLYSQRLKPGGKMEIIQIAGSCRQNEGREIVRRLIKNYRREIDDYENSVKEYAFRHGAFRTGDSVLDRSYLFAKAVLDVNRHYIDSVIMPMPCPAEYNFYFSHDVFLTDLAAVNFDLPRVKKDLEFTMKHSDKDYIIPHAYYWKDSSYKTEYATPDNWNHFWFIIVSASYLRHSGDRAMAEKLYPYLQKSVDETLLNMKDSIMYAYRPDWWDIGRSYGPRTFMTSLASRALADYVYILNFLGRKERLKDYENLSGTLSRNMNEKLWDDSLNYLINYFEDGTKDRHYYIGSLAAAVFRQLSFERTKAMASSAGKNLLDPSVGIYTVFPMDFHKLIKYLKLAGNEAGDPYYYINGGVWPHGNAFYALALKQAGRRKEAVDFVKRVMTLDGVINSPGGQPSMYEYRIAKKDSAAVYGKTDKPQFMWAAGFYIYSLYHLLGIEEGSWNIRFTPYLHDSQAGCTFTLNASGVNMEVSITGRGEQIKSIKYDGRSIPSAVIPADIGGIKRIGIELGSPEAPFLSRAESAVLLAVFNKGSRTLHLRLSAFRGHSDSLEVISPAAPMEISINGRKAEGGLTKKNQGGAYILHLNFTHEKDLSEITIRY